MTILHASAVAAARSRGSGVWFNVNGRSQVDGTPSNLNCEDLKIGAECVERLLWARDIPSDVHPCGLHLQIRSEFSGVMTAEYALRAAVQEYNKRGMGPTITTEVLSAADWNNSCQRVIANNFPNCCRFKDTGFERLRVLSTLVLLP